MICENADPDVRRDLETFMADLAPDGDPRFVHTAEGPDDMPAHVRSILTTSDLTIPISNGALALGTWQGVYLWEHRHARPSPPRARHDPELESGTDLFSAWRSKKGTDLFFCALIAAEIRTPCRAQKNRSVPFLPMHVRRK